MAGKEQVNTSLSEADKDLIEAAKTGDCESGGRLLRNGANIHAMDGRWSVLRTTVLCNRIEFVEMLLQNGVDVNRDNCLLAAVSRTKTECVKILIKHGCEIHLDRENGKSALHYATGTSEVDIDLVKLLVEAGVDVNHQDKNGNTALMNMASNSFASDEMGEIMRFLLNNGSKVNITNKEGKSAVHLCVSFGSREIMSMLIEAGAELNLPDNEGDYPIHRLKYVDLLFRAGADVNLKDSEGFSALHLAVKYLFVDRVGMLEGAGCDIESCNKKGLTPLLTLASNTRKSQVVIQIAEILIKLGANVNSKDTKSNTSLILASKNGNAELVLALVNAGADLNARNVYNQTALQLATDPDVVSLLNSRLEVQDACSVYKETISTIPKLLTIVQEDSLLVEMEKERGIQMVKELGNWLTKAIDLRCGEGVMTLRHRTMLREQRLVLVEELYPIALFSHFIQKSVFTENDVEEIKLEGTRRRMAEKLLDIIDKRGDTAFHVLCEALSDNGQQYLVDILQKE